MKLLLTLAPLLAAASAQLQRVLREAQPLADMPSLGFGTWNLDRHNASDAVVAAFKAGYRHIDCAAIYGNEKEVGDGIRRAMKSEGLKREEFWVTSKLWNDHHDPTQVPVALAKTLKDLQIPYLDLYHMHWPVAEHGGQSTISYVDTWRAMADLLTANASTPSVSSSHPPTRYIGVCNFSPAQLKTILPIYKPFAHQFEMHPYLPQTAWLRAHLDHGVRVTAYSPLGNTNPTYGPDSVPPPLLEDPTVRRIAARRGCTPAQLVLAWGMRRGASVIPKSQHARRIEENHDSLKCRLEAADFKVLGEVLPTRRFNNPSKGWGVELFAGLQDSNVASAHLGGGGWMLGLVEKWLRTVDQVLWGSEYQL